MSHTIAVDNPAHKTITPAGLYIPAYDGNPEVGLLTSRATKETYDDYGGATTITSGVTTIEGYRLPTGLDISGTAEVTIRDCLGEARITIDGSAEVYITDFLGWHNDWHGVYMPNDSATLLMEDFEIVKHPTAGGFNGGRGVTPQGSLGNPAILRRGKITGHEDGVDAWGHVICEQLWIAGDLYDSEEPPPNEPHSDGINTAADGLVIRYCHINSKIEPTDTYAQTGSASLFGDFGDVDGFEIHHSFMDWGQYLLTLEDTGQTHTNVRVYNNIFGANYSFGFVNYKSGVDIVEWHDNVDHLGAPVADPS